jgi:hypothetical protein
MNSNGKEMKTIPITREVKDIVNKIIKLALEFEQHTGKQFNITSILGEVLACDSNNLLWVVDGINKGFDAFDKDKKRVQIKARRYKHPSNATGSLLDKNFDVPFDYALLVLLNKDYTFRDILRIEADQIKEHFERINNDRVSKGKPKRKTMSVWQFDKISKTARQ